MRPSAILLTGLFGICALGLTVWIGRYEGGVPPLVKELTKKEEHIGPPISPTGPHPKVVVDEKEYNFGVMSPKSKGSHVFVIKNEGEADLEVMARKEDTTCSCTFGELSNEGKIPPGQSVEVTLNWEIKVPDGEFRHRAVVRTNDPNYKEVEFVVMGEVQAPYQVRPEGTWNLGEQSGEAPIETKGAIFTAQALEFQILELKGDKGLVEFQIEPMTDEELKSYEAKCGYMVTAMLKQKIPAGITTEMVTVKTEDSDQGNLTFNVSAARANPIEIIGPGYQPRASALLMGEFPASQGKSQTLSLFVRDMEEELVLREVKTMHNTVQVEMTKDPKITGNAQRFLLKITVPPQPPQDRQRKLSEKVDLFFNHPDVPEMRLYIDFLSV